MPTGSPITTIPITVRIMTRIESPSPLRLRHELKHQIPLWEDLVLAGRLRKLLPHDPHGGADGTYTVTSLYFDTPYDDALREKLDGVDRREKFRLRYYGSDVSFLRLEKKCKIRGLCGKRGARLTHAQAQRLLDGDYGFLAEGEDPLLMELYSKLQGCCLRPRTVVCYDREAFTYRPGNVRVTLDRHVRTGLDCLDFLHPRRFQLQALEDLTVLEVKYDAFLPDLIRMAVQTPGRQAAACSKYALCRRFD